MVAALVLIAFLRAGDVWLTSTVGAPPANVTRTGGRVEDYRYSADGQFLAYAKRIRRSEERPISSIVVTRTDTRKVLTEIFPDEGWIDIDRWLGHTLVYHSSSGMEVSGVYEFNAATGRKRELDPSTGWMAMDSDASADGELLLYTDDAGLGATYENRLHLDDRRSRTDRVLVRKRSVMSPALNPAHDAVAFLEVVDSPGTPPSRDHVWIHRIDGDTRMVFDGPVQAKSGGSALTWSTDGSRLAMNFGSRIVLIDPAGVAAPRELQGADACWTTPRSLVAADQAGVTMLDVDSGVRQVVAGGASRPQCVADAAAKGGR